ncbi:hypothetical protein MRB53_008372 [Persea americana]|uniref:Uncharacterized protein n=1 Tax=Persea americana TaxID=3435 RepID=A0ACC2MLX6_PERAE|nr:hypothetical protein MRB53_008372 [Persea americana]
MGGLGKTTLPQLFYNEERVEAYSEKRIWVCVSDPFDVNGIATEEKLSVPPKDAAQGSKVVVTTRSHRVAVAMDTPRINVNELGILSNSDCWEVSISGALKGTEEENCRELTKKSEKIIERCKGVPLAVRAVGSFLRRTREERYWEHVLDIEIWEWDIANDDIHKDGKHSLKRGCAGSSVWTPLSGVWTLEGKSWKFAVQRLVSELAPGCQEWRQSWRPDAGRQYAPVLCAMALSFSN